MNDSIKNQKQQLRAMLKKQSAKLCNEAIQAEGHLSPSQLEELEELERLVKTIDHAEIPSPFWRWRIIILMLVTLIIVSILLFARVSSTKIELDLSLSEVNFRLSQPQVLAGLMRLKSLGVSGIEEIRLPQTEKKESRIFNSSDGASLAIKLSGDTAGKNESSLTLQPLMLQKGNYAWVQPDDEYPSEYHLSIRSPGLSFQADVFGSILVGLPASPKELFIFNSPKSVMLRAGRNDADLTIEPLQDTKTTFLKQLFIDSLSMFHIDQYLSEEQTIVKQISTVQSGILFYESLNGLDYKLRANQEIHFKKINGFIRTMEIKNGQIAFTFYGTVIGMSTGSENNNMSLMPSYLDWLMARHSLSLLWGTTLYFFGLIVSLINWWKTAK